MSAEPEPIRPITSARVLVKVGDSVTTDHISPAGSIPADMPAGQYLLERGVKKHEFNSFGSRRGNDRVMTRGTFGNIRLRNQLAPGTEGGWTTYLPTGEVMPIFNASQKYQAGGIPLLVIAGQEYGAGSSRDWAAKGALLLGVKAVLAESYERIHRSNLIGMGVLPLQFLEGQSAQQLGLTGRERYDLDGVGRDFKPGSEIRVTATRDDGERKEFRVRVRLDTPIEVEYYRHGGILPYVIRQLMQ
jgi:aconitate hydratase